MKLYGLKVSKKTNLTPSSCYITLSVADSLKSNFKYKAGQYVTISIKDKNGIKQNRSYSICGPINDKDIYFCVKKIPGGVVSTFLCDELKKGDVLDVSQPMGDFTLESSNGFNKKNNVFISAGSGITPIKSQIEKLLHNKYKGEIYLIFANNSQEEVIFYDYFKEIEEKHSNFHLILILKETPLEWNGEQGILVTDKISSLFTEYNLPINNSNYYICGPQVIVDNSKEYLKSEGVKNNRIFTEKFFTSAPKNLDLKKIYDTIVIANGKEYTLKIKGDETILQATINAGINVDYSCRNGSCLSCTCELSSGKIIAQNDSELTEEQKNNNIILACQSYANSENIKINYDTKIKKSILHNRNKLIAVGLIAFLFLSLFLLRPSNELFLAKGHYNIGHEDLKCSHCHQDAPGTTRQQIQRKVQIFLGSELPDAYLGKSPVENGDCLHCHIRPNDAHPIYRFMEPKFKEAREAIHPENCVSCHAEHKKERVTFKETGYCVNCHKDIEIKNDPLDMKHEVLIKKEMWNTCVQCHDFHGNHEMKTPDKIKDTIPLIKIKEYFKDGEDPYSKVKKYVANLDSINTLNK